MTVRGEMFIGGRAVPGSSGSHSPVSTTTGQTLVPAFGGATHADLDVACRLADEAFDTYRETAPEVRAALLEGSQRMSRGSVTS